MTDASPIEWTDDGQPRSRLFGDVYFSAEDGLAESRTVFLEGCGLPEAWAGRRRFVVGELGFGTGLNVAALLQLWSRTRPQGARLHIFTVEAHPVAAEEAARALSRWPELAGISHLMTSRWPGRAQLIHRAEFPELGAILDVAVMDAGQALDGWIGRADAWFLDGFSPALNPQMWSDQLLAAVAARSAPGARAATFTVAGQVRRALASAGFDVEKRPGFGRKRGRLEARLPGDPPSESATPSVAILGAGIAGAAAARAFRALGAEPVVVEPSRPGAGASGNPAVLVTPRLDAGQGEPARLYGQAFARAIQLYEALPQAIIARGVLQLAREARDAPRFTKIAEGGFFEPGALKMLGPRDASALLGEAGPASLLQATALVIEPRLILEDWLAGTPVVPELPDADVVVVAAGFASAALASALPLAPARGQASWTDAAGHVMAAAWGGYVLPTRDGLLFGATYDRGDESLDVRDADHLRNLETLAAGRPELAARLADAPRQGRAAIRAATPDRLPIAGAAVDAGRFALTGFGARGFTFAPLLAEHVAALALGAPSPMLAPQAALVAPARFLARRGRP